MRKLLLLAGAGLVVVALAASAFAGPGGRHGCAGFQGDGPRQGAMMLERFDADGDGRITRAEIDAQRDDAFARFDADSDGGLTLDEFEGYWAEFARPRMVDRFQALDDDGDGIVTVDEVDARVNAMFAWADRNGDGALSRDDRPARGDRWRNN